MTKAGVRGTGRFAPATGLTLWFAYVLTVTVLALGVSWGAYAQFDYGYPLWYKMLHIDEHIDEYAPQNRYHRLDLEMLGPDQHQALFHQIVNAVHDHGRGLAEIVYPDRYGTLVPLLRRPEIQHLRDVAGFIDRGRWLWVVLALLWLPLARAVRARPPGAWRGRALITGIPLAAMLAWLLISGPEAVFYQFHRWLFPPHHEWFFYWQDSLMSTLMKAPDLFGAIAAVLVGSTIILTPLLYWGGPRLVRGRRQSSR